MKKIIMLLICLSISISDSEQPIVLEDSDKKNYLNGYKIEEIKAGTLVKKISNSDRYEVIPQLETNISVDIQGMVASTIMDQIFINTSSKPIEAQYIFPLNNNCAIYDMFFIIDDRIVSSKIEEKIEAKRQYNEAKKDGKKASILNQQRPNIFSQSIANIMPNDSIRIRIKYVEPIAYENGEFEFRLPLSITPRYGEDNSEIEISKGVNRISSIVPDKSKINPQYIPKEINSGRGVAIDLSLDAGIEIIDCSSSHPILKNIIDKTKINVSLQNERIIADQDFIFKYKIEKKDEPQIATFISEMNGEDYYMIQAIPPKPKKDKNKISKEMTFIIDVSSSMHGNNMMYAKSALLEGINALSDDDYFNIIQFNDRFEYFKPYPIPASRDNIKDGLNYVSNLYANGGTHALPALEWAMNEPKQDKTMKMIVFITDGAVGYEDAVFSTINQSLGNTRIFPIAIGSAPNSFLLEKVAQISRGTHIYIKNNNDIISKMSGLLNKINKPILSDIKITLDKHADYYPNPIKDLYHNEPLVIFGKSDKINNKIKIEAETARGSYKKTIKIKKRRIKEHKSIPILWARKKIDFLMNQYRLNGTNTSDNKKDIKNQIVSISKKYNVLSKFTSFIAIENIISNYTGELFSTNVPSELPKNFEIKQIPKSDKKNNYKLASANISKKHSPRYINNRLPQTSTNNPLYLFVGSSLLLLSLILIQFRKCRLRKNV